MGFECQRDGHSIISRRAALRPVHRGDAHAHRLVRGPRAPAGVEDLQRKAQAVQERPAVLVLAQVRQRRNVRGEQVPVRHVHFEQVEARGLSALGGSDVVGQGRVHVRLGHGARRRAPVAAVGECRRRHHRPAAVDHGRIRRPLPRPRGRPLPACVPELYAHLRG